MFDIPGQEDCSSGERSPETIEVNDTEEPSELIEYILDEKFKLTLTIDQIQNILYCKASDLAPLVGIDSESLIKLLKRKGTSVGIDKPFKPRTMFKNRKLNVSFFSVTCFR